MNLLINRNDLIHYSDNVWMTKPHPFVSGTRMQSITLFMRLEDETLAAFAYLSLEPDGTYYVKNEAIGKFDDPSFREYIDKLTGINRTPSQNKTYAVNEIDKALFTRVCESYDQTGSIKKTAHETGTSEQKTRKILITKGKYTCENHRRIIQMLEEGKNIEQIGKALNISRGQIISYLPYGGTN